MRPDQMPDGQHTEQPLAPAETTHFQVVYALHDSGNQLFREGVPTLDRAACEAVASAMMQRHDVHTVFICTVHAAYQKETTVKKVI